MREYELVLVIDPELEDEQLSATVDRVTQFVTTRGGEVIDVNPWGKRRLSYPIKKFKEGSYVYMELSGPGEMVGAIETFYKVNDPVIRYLTVKVEKKKKAAPEKVQVTTEEVKIDESAKPQTSGAE